MKPTIPRVLILIILFAYAGTAFGADTPPPDPGTADWLLALYTAVTSKQWGVVAGIGLIALVYPLRLYGPGIFKTPLGGIVLAFLVSFAGTVGIALAAGASPSLAIFVSAATTAATAAGVWEWMKSQIPGVRKAADKAVEIPTATVMSGGGSFGGGGGGPLGPSGQRLSVVLLLLIGAVAMQPACAASQRESTIKAAIVTVDASRDAFLAYDSSEQDQIVANATSLEQGKTALAEYRAKRSKVEIAFGVAYRSIAVATTLNDQPSLDGIKVAIAMVADQVRALMGGAK